MYIACSLELVIQWVCPNWGLQGVKVNVELAEHWFTKEGSAEAFYSIAQLYV